MNSKIRMQLQQLFADEELPEWQRSSRLLSLAYAYCRSTLEETSERAALLLGLAALSKSLAEGSTALADLTRILQQAGPSVQLKQALEHSRTNLSAGQKELLELRQAIVELEKSEAQLTAMTTERDRLRSRLAYLQQLSQVDPQELEDLRRQVAEKDSGDVAINIIIP